VRALLGGGAGGDKERIGNEILEREGDVVDVVPTLGVEAMQLDL